MPSPRKIAHSLTLKSLMAAALAGAMLLGFLLPASAKGPESVTIFGPGIEQPLELIDPDDFSLLVTLMEQTGLWYGTGDPIARPPGELGPAYILTWINGGPPALLPEERTITQLLYLDAQGGPLIHTPDQETLANWGPGVTGWFAAPEGLRETLLALGAPVAAAPMRGLNAGTIGLLLAVGLLGLGLFFSRRRTFGGEKTLEMG